MPPLDDAPDFRTKKKVFFKFLHYELFLELIIGQKMTIWKKTPFAIPRAKEEFVSNSIKRRWVSGRTEHKNITTFAFPGAYFLNLASEYRFIGNQTVCGSV